MLHWNLAFHAAVLLRLKQQFGVMTELYSAQRHLQREFSRGGQCFLFDGSESHQTPWTSNAESLSLVVTPSLKRSNSLVMTQPVHFLQSSKLQLAGFTALFEQHGILSRGALGLDEDIWASISLRNAELYRSVSASEFHYGALEEIQRKKLHTIG